MASVPNSASMILYTRKQVTRRIGIREREVEMPVGRKVVVDQHAARVVLASIVSLRISSRDTALKSRREEQVGLGDGAHGIARGVVLEDHDLAEYPASSRENRGICSGTMHVTSCPIPRSTSAQASEEPTASPSGLVWATITILRFAGARSSLRDSIRSFDSSISALLHM